jgi:hypothetical protein
MLFDKGKATTPSVPIARKQLQNVRELRSGLGLVRNFRVTHAERRAKEEATKILSRQAVTASLDIASAEIEVETTTMKTALLARAVPVLGAITSELIARSGAVNHALTALMNDGMLREIDGRREFSKEIERRRLAGSLTDEEATEAGAFIQAAAARNCGRLERNTDRALDALDAHVCRTTDHIRNTKLG